MSTTLSKYDFLNYLTEGVELSDATLQGIGDDAAVLNQSEGSVLSTSRLFIEGIHFDLSYTPLKHLGFKVVVVAITNVLSMNVFPKQILIALGVPKEIKANQLKELYEGIYAAAKLYKIDVVGGDLVPSWKGLNISISAIASADSKSVVYRKHAQVNDLVCITGDLGAAYFGFHILERERAVFEVNAKAQPELSGYDYIIGRWLRPMAPYQLIRGLHDNDVLPTAMTDISNGLASAVLNIARASQVGLHIYLDKIPISSDTFHVAEELNFDAVTAAMNGGGDYELLFTVPLSKYDDLKKMNCIEVIGHVVPAEKQSLLVPPNGDPVEIKAQILHKPDNA